MKGFFTREEIRQQTAVHIDMTSANCIECGLYRTAKSPKMKHHGQGKLNTLILAEAPGPDEDEYGRQLVGKTGGFITRKLTKRGYNLKRDFWRFNAVNCRPIDAKGNNRTPNSNEIHFCRPSVLNTINELDPKFIWVMGGVPIESLLGQYFNNTSIGRWRGTFIPDQDLKKWILPIYHPSFPNRDTKNANLQAFYDHDLDRVLKFIGKNHNKEFPIYPDGRDQIRVLTDINEILSALRDVENFPLIYIDYETSGLKPYIPGHKIASVSITTPEYTISFPYEYASFFTSEERLKIKQRLQKIWTNENIKKVAHNSKYEHIWTTNILDVTPANWWWCSLMGAHIQDNRQSWSGLKFQVYVNFGIKPWSGSVEPYLNSHGEPFNNIDKCPLDDLLLYGGMDTYWGYKLYQKQVKFYDDPKHSGLKNAFDLFNEGSIVLAEIQDNGINVDEEYCKSEQDRYKKRIQVIENRLYDSEEAKQFKEHTGRELRIKEKDFSDHDLRILFYDVLGYESVKTTEKAKKDDKSSKTKSVDEETLRNFESSFADLVLKRRKFRKIEGTYLGQFLRETYHGMMHPFFDLIIPVSYRGSSSFPNFQNIPKRDKHAKKATRRAIKPSKGNQILESDFSGIEVAVNACYNHDPTLIAEVTDPDADMHRDTGADIWKIKREDVHDEIRFYSKNQMVFPEFYGSWYDQCAKNLWRTALREKLKTNSGTWVIDHIRSYGINNLEEFIEHVKEVEKTFWNDRFKKYAQWKRDIQVIYRQQGYIETFLGFRFQTYMGFNECTNYPAQGTAFHILLWTLIQVSKEIKKRGLLSKIIGQIHDSMVIDAVPSEVKQLIEIINHWGTVMTREIFKWIIVPLKIDHEVTPVDGTWYDKRKVK